MFLLVEKSQGFIYLINFLGERIPIETIKPFDNYMFSDWIAIEQMRCSKSIIPQEIIRIISLKDILNSINPKNLKSICESLMK